jgi:hypothetical protein
MLTGFCRKEQNRISELHIPICLIWTPFHLRTVWTSTYSSLNVRDFDLSW